MLNWKTFAEEAARAMGFATGIDEFHILYEFRIDKALWTTWLDFGTTNHRPEYVRWSLTLGTKKGHSLQS